jgi:hypothetical protein
LLVNECPHYIKVRTGWTWLGFLAWLRWCPRLLGLQVSLYRQPCLSFFWEIYMLVFSSSIFTDKRCRLLVQRIGHQPGWGN